MERPDDWELVAFFEREPVEIDREEAEFFGIVTFEHGLGGGDVLVCDVGTYSPDLVLTLVRDGVEQIVLRADDAANLKIERLHGVETLVALLGEAADRREVRLTLRPTLRLEWGAKFQG